MVVQTALLVPKAGTLLRALEHSGSTNSSVLGGLGACFIIVMEPWGADCLADWTDSTVASVTGRIAKSLRLLPASSADTIRDFMMVLVVDKFMSDRIVVFAFVGHEFKLVVIFCIDVGVVCVVFAVTGVAFIRMEVVVKVLFVGGIVALDVFFDVVRLVGVVVALFGVLVAVG